MKMVWAHADHDAELRQLRRRVTELERELEAARDEYRAACESLAGALTDLSDRFEDHLAWAQQHSHPHSHGGPSSE